MCNIAALILSTGTKHTLSVITLRVCDNIFHVDSHSAFYALNHIFNYVLDNISFYLYRLHFMPITCAELVFLVFLKCYKVLVLVRA